MFAKHHIHPLSMATHKQPHLGQGRLTSWSWHLRLELFETESLKTTCTNLEPLLGAHAVIIVINKLFTGIVTGQQWGLWCFFVFVFFYFNTGCTCIGRQRPGRLGGSTRLSSKLSFCCPSKNSPPTVLLEFDGEAQLRKEKDLENETKNKTQMI